MPPQINLHPAYVVAEKLHADPELVKKVWDESIRQKIDPLLSIALVDHETGGKWDPNIIGGADPNDYGLFQINKKWHRQYVGDVDKHIQEGVSILRSAINTYGVTGGLSFYNSGNPDNPRGKHYVSLVLPKYDQVRTFMSDFWKGLRQSEFDFGNK